MSNQPGMFDTPAEVEKNPVRPYAGESGNTGGNRITDRRTIGRTQAAILRTLREHPVRGCTVAELREELGLHHGTVSGALSEMHRTNLICRLTETRDRCSIYMLPEHVGSRRTVNPKPTMAHLGRRVSECEEVEKHYAEHVRYDGHDYYLAADLLAALMEGYE